MSEPSSPEIFRGKMFPCHAEPCSQWTKKRLVITQEGETALTHPEFRLIHTAPIPNSAALYEVWRSWPHNGRIKGSDAMYYPARHLLVRLAKSLGETGTGCAFCFAEIVPNRHYRPSESFLIRNANDMAKREAADQPETLTGETITPEPLRLPAEATP